MITDLPRTLSGYAMGSLRLSLAAATCAVACAAVAQAQTAQFAAANSRVTIAADDGALVNGIRAQDEILLVDVRPLRNCCDPAIMAEAAQFEAYQATDASGYRQWQSASLERFRAADPSVATVIFVHGNKITPWDAKCEGLAAYRRLARQAPTAAPIRFVIFSWPSAQISGPLRDVRAKAARTRPAGCQLAWLVDQLPAETPLTLVGFSFGARIVTGALHILGGGSLGGMGLDEIQHSERRPMDVVLLAAAIHSDWLYPGHCHGQAMSQVERMLLLNNRADPAMRFYHFSATSGKPRALGLSGPTCIDAAGAAKIVERDLSRCVGREHDLFRYLSAPGVIGQVWDYTVPTGATN